MQFRFDSFEPPPELGRLLRCSFFAKGRIAYRSDKILPTAQIAVLFNIGNPHRLGKSPDSENNPTFPHSWIDGFQTTPNYHTPLDGTHVFGLLFEPIGFHALFGADMVALKDKSVDARTLLPKDFVQFVEKRLSRADREQTHAQIHGCLLGIEQVPLPDWLWDFYADVVAEHGAIDLDAYYTKCGHSGRHVSQQFKRCVGVTPKSLCRIHRLLALLEAIDPQHEVNWTELAHQFEFYDQPHFNREFRRLTGLFPSEYLEQRRRDLPDLQKGESVAFAPQR